MNRQQMEAHLTLLGWAPGATRMGNPAMLHHDKSSAVGVTPSVVTFRVNAAYVQTTDMMRVPDDLYMAMAERILAELA